ncbi:MAG: hypothetical protein QOI10_200 [Solirubrobacterales bacterium]|jgi:hypothetical protein|nr:hypothetical protein [Solirubrobacterales bacterium]
MAVMMSIDFPATVEQYDAVNDKLDIYGDLPEGLIVHTGAELGPEMVRVLDIWESEDHWRRFNEERLAGAIAEVMGEPPPDAPPPPEPQFTELHTVIKP